MTSDSLPRVTPADAAVAALLKALDERPEKFALPVPVIIPDGDHALLTWRIGSAVALQVRWSQVDDYHVLTRGEGCRCDVVFSSRRVGLVALVVALQWEALVRRTGGGS